MHLVMFDVDGTLVDSAGFDAELYSQAVESELGVTVDRGWNRYEHVTDSGILDQIVREHGFEARRDELVDRVQRRFVARVRDYLMQNAAAVREIAGARRLVERLLGLPGVRVAVATGGWGETARLKLAHVGMPVARIPLASASDATARTAIMRLAEQRAMQGSRPIRATYFGDGPWDQRASAELGYAFVAVGCSVSHRVAYDDLSDIDGIFAHLAGAGADAREPRLTRP